MTLQDSAKGTCGRDDLLLQKVTQELVAYRLVVHDPPTEDDFKSHYEAGEAPHADRPLQGVLMVSWFGVSLFIDRGRIDRLAARAHEQGQRAGIARVRITPGDGLYAMYTSKSTHLEVFGFPEHLLARVDGIEN